MKANISIFEHFKSVYIIKSVFSLLINKNKLQLIKYSKYLQNKIEITIEDFKKESGRYFIGDRNGLGKEFDIETNSLKFEGEYSKGKRNGKGKEYNSDKIIIIEGEYLNGKRNGKIKEYNNDGKLIFEGEYLNGKKNGKGKEFSYYESRLIFEGEYLEGKRWTGKGYDNNSNVVLELNNGKGEGEELDSTFTLKYNGQFLKGE